MRNQKRVESHLDLVENKNHVTCKEMQSKGKMSQ